MQFLKHSFLWILLAASAGLWVYKDVTRAGVCEAPIKFTLGQVDPRFGLSETEYKNTIEEATQVWEEATGKNLFAYVEPVKPNRFYETVGKYFVRAKIPVNLVYDERQVTTNKRSELLSDVNETKESTEVIKAQLTSLQNRYQQAVAEYRTLQNEYKKRKATYEELEAKRLQVNSLADQTNALVKKHNALVGEINSTINTINNTGRSEFEEGQYVSDQNGERITIFAYTDHTELVRVLAHELGHALGLEHNDNPDSIMYYLNDSRVLTPSKEDLSDLNAICKAR